MQKIKTIYQNAITDKNYKIFGLIQDRNKTITYNIIRKFFNKMENLKKIIKIEAVKTKLPK